MIRQHLSGSLFVGLLSLGSLAGRASASTLSYPDFGAPAPAVKLTAVSAPSSFELLDSHSGSADVYSSADNPAGMADLEVMPVADDPTDRVQYPAGIYVALEDLLRSQGAEFTQKNGPFLFSNVLAASFVTATPEPASLALLGTGALGAVALLRRRVR